TSSLRPISSWSRSAAPALRRTSRLPSRRRPVGMAMEIKAPPSPLPRLRRVLPRLHHPAKQASRGPRVAGTPLPRLRAGRRPPPPSCAGPPPPRGRVAPPGVGGAGLPAVLLRGGWVVGGGGGRPRPGGGG